MFNTPATTRHRKSAVMSVDASLTLRTRGNDVIKQTIQLIIIKHDESTQ